MKSSRMDDLTVKDERQSEKMESAASLSRGRSL